MIYELELDEKTFASRDLIKEAIARLIAEHTDETIDKIKESMSDLVDRMYMCSDSNLCFDFTVTIPKLLVIHAVRKLNKERRIRPVDNFDEWGW